MTSPDGLQLRFAARRLFDQALQAVDAGAAVRRAVVWDEGNLVSGDVSVPVGQTVPVYSIAIGKAATAMASALDQMLGEHLTAGIVSGPLPSRNSFDSKRWQLFSGGHPLPNQASLAAARAAMTLAQQANQARGLIIFLVSGGGSAMFELPVDDSITLPQLAETNRVLVSCGASITEINSVRRAFSAVKGGKLAALAPDCDQITLIVSDVPTGHETSVASGPTVASEPDVLNVLERYDLRSKLPASILRAIERGHWSKDGAPASDAVTGRQDIGQQKRLVRKLFVLLDNQRALEAVATAATQIGFITEIARDVQDQTIAEGCSQLWERFESLCQSSVPEGANTVCLVSGGEFACPVMGSGMGGRSQETALRLALLGRSCSTQIEHFVALCAGTDGVDGNSPAAGALVDDTTVDRARAIGLEVDDYLKRSDAYSFFVALGDTITTGQTGTNVRDVRILLAKVR